MTGSQAVIQGLLANGVNCGFGIPSIHNIALYEVLRTTPEFRHWTVRHEQAAGFAADGYYRRSGHVAAVFASTGPGNLFTLVPLLEALQAGTPLLVIGTNIASHLREKSGGALHETPQQIEIVRPLVRLAYRVTSPDEIPEAIAAATAVLHGPAPGPAFIEIPHDLLSAPVTRALAEAPKTPAIRPAPQDIAAAGELIVQSRRPALLIGGGAKASSAPVQKLAEILQAPVFSATSGKGLIPDDHPLAMGCISRQGLVREVLDQSDLLISCGARITEFDTGRFQLRLPARHLQIVADRAYPGDRFAASQQLVGDLGAMVELLSAQMRPRAGWCDVTALRTAEKSRLENLKSEAYAAIQLLRSGLDRDDVVVNDQSILNYWASAFFPVLAPETFLYPLGSGTLGYGLPAAIGAACATQQSGGRRKIICVAGDGGFQYTLHELATLAQYQLPVKVLLVNDSAYGIIGFLQRTMFGREHEVALRNPDFCRVAEAYGVRAERVSTLEELQRRLTGWLEGPGPALLEWRTQLKSPWESGAIPPPSAQKPARPGDAVIAPPVRQQD
ncbi:MAG TPA: thiamine pyrophosphate-binding protein [Candidatus Angelobacter sp.]|nr:thiamine pyrophosphate-binding protein [Candidatus Angelobacter sp.]